MRIRMRMKGDKREIQAGGEMRLTINKNILKSAFVIYTLKLVELGSLRNSHPKDYAGAGLSNLSASEPVAVIGRREDDPKENFLILWRPVNLRHIGISSVDFWLSPDRQSPLDNAAFLTLGRDTPLPPPWKITTFGSFNFQCPFD